MTTFDFQIHVAVQIPGRRESHRISAYVGTVEAAEEADVTQLGAAARVEALQAAAQTAIERIGKSERQEA